MGVLPNRTCLTMGVFPSSSGINKTHLEFRSQRASDNATVLKLFPTIVEKHHGAKQEISYKPVFRDVYVEATFVAMTTQRMLAMSTESLGSKTGYCF